MKTISDIKTEMQSAIDSVTEDFTIPQKKRVGERVKFYKFVIAFLESEPKEEDLKTQLEEVKRKIKVIINGIGQWKANTPESKLLKNAESAYNNEMGLAGYRKQEKTLKYILGL